VTGKKVLIIDDESSIREMIAIALEMAGYECLEAENIQQALKTDAIVEQISEQFKDARNFLNYLNKKNNKY